MSDTNTKLLATVALGAAAVGAGVAYSLCSMAEAHRAPLHASTDDNKGPATPTTPGQTTAQIIDGKGIAKAVRLEIKHKVEELVAIHHLRPGLGVVIVGDRKDSQTYVRMKKKAAAEVGLHSIVVEMPGDSTQQQIIEQVRAMNTDPLIHGILVQLPLPSGVDEEAVLRTISIAKDVDGFCAENIGHLALRGHAPLAIPCTPAGCMELLKRSNITVQGKNCVVVGRSNIVGMPMAALLQAMDGTVTVCHSKTKNIAEKIKEADIVVAAVGKARFVQGSWLKPGCVVLDVGINSVPDSSRKRGYRLVGDVDFDSAKQVAGYITPVPGGVGPMTIAMLLTNTLSLYQYSVAGDTPKTLTRPTSTHKLSEMDKRNAPQSPRSRRSKGPSSNDNHDNHDNHDVHRHCQTLRPVPSDIAISQSVEPLPIEWIAASMGLLNREALPYGANKAKVSLAVLDRLGDGGEGALVVVCGINPTPLGEGKSTTTIGLCQALGAHLKKRIITTIRQPSQGPTFGIKGGAAGGGYSQVIPMEEFNLHLTGDIHAITAANNLLAAALDTRIFHEASVKKDETLFKRLVPLAKDGSGTRPFAKVQQGRLLRLGITDPDKLNDGTLLSPSEQSAFARLDIDTSTITWNRVLDTCDRHLRKIEIGHGPNEKTRISAKSGKTLGCDPRSAGFDITVASEIMAVLALATSLKDMRDRLGRMTVARSRMDGLHHGSFVTADDLGVGGALLVLMKEALQPTLMQTIEGTPVFVHAGPFANIAHGNSSVVADQIALKLVGEDGYVVTEAGFGADIGAEKFFNIKARAGKLKPKCAVVVATVRALKLHGGAPPVKANKPLAKEYKSEHLDVLAKGCPHLQHHVRCITENFGVRVVVAVNKMSSDSEAELAMVCQAAKDAGAFDAVVSSHWEDGGKGAVALAHATMQACEDARRNVDSFKYLYDIKATIKEKLFTVCSKVYNAGAVTYSAEAEAAIAAYEQNGCGEFPVCIAKTQYSLSTDSKAVGVPTGHTVNVREVKASMGAGMIVAICGDIMTIPGLPTRPGFVDVDYDFETNKIVGLF